MFECLSILTSRPTTHIKPIRYSETGNKKNGNHFDNSTTRVLSNSFSSACQIFYVKIGFHSEKIGCSKQRTDEVRRCNKQFYFFHDSDSDWFIHLLILIREPHRPKYWDFLWDSHGSCTIQTGKSVKISTNDSTK